MDTVEARIAEIVCAILERPHIDPHANLTEAGADSLRAVEIISRIELEYGVDLVDAYFSAPMIARLAAEVRSSQDRAGDEES
jgi:acyl carrier protein